MKSETELEMEYIAKREFTRQIQDDIREAIWIHEQQYHQKKGKKCYIKDCRGEAVYTFQGHHLCHRHFGKVYHPSGGE